MLNLFAKRKDMIKYLISVDVLALNFSRVATQTLREQRFSGVPVPMDILAAGQPLPARTHPEGLVLGIPSKHSLPNPFSYLSAVRF